MHFVDIDTGTEYEVAYTGGTDIQDKYGKIIAATGTQLGQIYDVTCNKSGKATEIHGSSDEMCIRDSGYTCKNSSDYRKTSPDTGAVCFPRTAVTGRYPVRRPDRSRLPDGFTKKRKTADTAV